MLRASFEERYGSSHYQKNNYLHVHAYLKTFFLVSAGDASLEHSKVDESTIAIGCWKGKASLTVMVNAIDCQELLERLVIRMETEESLVKEEKTSNLEVGEAEDMNEIENEDEYQNVD